MNKKEEKKERDLVNAEKNRGSTMQIVLGIVGIIILIICLIAGYNMMLIQSLVPTNAVNTIPREFYNAFSIFVIGIGFFAGFSLWGIAYLIHNKQMKKDLSD